MRDLLVAAGIPTPAYFYDLDAIAAQAGALLRSLEPTRGVLAYAVKANSAGSILRTLASLGAGADVVSGAELELALACGVRPERLVMSGVGKTDAELDLAIRHGVLGIQAESLEEVQRLAARARAQGKSAALALRINPNVSIASHAHIATGHDGAKFGIRQADLSAVFDLIEAASGSLSLAGISTHVGSMLGASSAYLESARVVCRVTKAARERGFAPAYINFGGGFGVDYGEGAIEAPQVFVKAALELLAAQGLTDLPLVVEPGRSLVAPFGVLLARVIQTKQSGERRWLMVDAGMNDLLRPALYGAHHRIEALDESPGSVAWRVVGPVCESSDDFGVHHFGEQAPEWVAIRDAGAYGFAMASEYNGRALPAEVFVSGGHVQHVSSSPGSAAWLKRRLEA